MKFLSNFFRIPFLLAENAYLKTENERLREERDKLFDKILRLATGEGLTGSPEQVEAPIKKETPFEWAARQERESLERYEARIQREAKEAEEKRQKEYEIKVAQDVSRANPDGVN